MDERPRSRGSQIACGERESDCLKHCPAASLFVSLFRYFVVSTPHAMLCTKHTAVTLPPYLPQAPAAPKAFVRLAQAAGVSITSLSLAAAAYAGAATVKLGADNGALVFDPATLTISSGDSVTFVVRGSCDYWCYFGRMTVIITHMFIHTYSYTHVFTHNRTTLASPTTLCSMRMPCPPV